MLYFLVGFRKFTVTILFLITMIVFRILDYVDGEQFSTNVQTVFVAFLGTNIGEHLINFGKEWVYGKVKNTINGDNSEILEK